MLCHDSSLDCGTKNATCPAIGGNSWKIGLMDRVVLRTRFARKDGSYRMNLKILSLAQGPRLPQRRRYWKNKLSVFRSLLKLVSNLHYLRRDKIRVFFLSDYFFFRD